MDIKKRIQELSLDQKAKLYFMGLVRQGKIDRLPEDPKAAYVSMMMDEPEDLNLEPEEEDSYRDMIQGKYSDDDLRLEPEDNEYEDGTEFEDDDLRLEPELDEDRDKEDEENDRNLALDDIPASLRELSTELGYLKEEYNMDLMRYHGGDRDKAATDAYEKEYKKTEVSEVDGMEGGMDLNAMQYKKVEFVYTEQGGRFYGLDVYVSKDQPQRSDKLRYDEANEWLKDTLSYIHKDDLIPRKYNSGLEDLDLIVDRLRELGIEASHGDYMDVS